jgi:hypothetical protein
LTLSIQLGDQEPQTLRAVPVDPSGSAPVRQAAVFSVRRPLTDAAVTYRVRLQQGAVGHAVLELVCRWVRQTSHWMFYMLGGLPAWTAHSEYQEV